MILPNLLHIIFSVCAFMQSGVNIINVFMAITHILGVFIHNDQLTNTIIPKYT